MLLLSLKWHEVSKANIYYEIFDKVIKQFFPIDVTANIAINLRFNGAILSFATDYFNFWPNLAMKIATIALEYAGRAFMYGESFPVVDCIMNMAFLAISIWTLHLCITKMGMIFVDAEILR